MKCIKKCLSVILVVIICTACGNNLKNKEVLQWVSSEEVDASNTLVSEVCNEDVKDLDYIIPFVYNIVNKEDEVDTVNLTSELDINGKVYPYSYWYYKEYQDIYKDLYKGFYNFETDIALDTKLNSDTFLKFLFQVVLDNPDFYYVGLNWKLGIDEDGYVNLLTTDYKYTKEEVLENSKELQNVVDCIRSYLPDNISDYDTYVFLHDFIVQNTEYDEFYTNEYKHDSDVVGCLLYKKCTCEGFAQGYKYLCREFGYQTALCDGKALAPHLWNIVPYGNDWFHVDVGMDNVDSDIVNDWSKHNNFGLCDAYITNEGNHEITIDGSYSNYIAHPNCTNSMLAYKNMQGDIYTINTGTAKERIKEVSISSLNKGLDYVEFSFEDSASLNEVRNTLLNQYEDELYALLEEINESVEIFNIDVETVGLSFEDWDNTVLIYYFKE